MNELEKLFGISESSGDIFSELFGLSHGSPFSDLFCGRSSAKNERASSKGAEKLKDPDNFIQGVQISSDELAIKIFKRGIRESFGAIKDLRAELSIADKKNEELTIVNADQGAELSKLQREMTRLEKYNLSLLDAVDKLSQENDLKREKIASLMEIVTCLATIDISAAKADLKKDIKTLQRHIKIKSKKSDAEAVDSNAAEVDA